MMDVKEEFLQALKASSQSSLHQFLKTYLNWANVELDEGITVANYLAGIGDADRLSLVLNEDIRLLYLRDRNNISLLHTAAFNGHTEVVRDLIYYGIGIHIRTNIPKHELDNKTALDFAKQNNHLDCVEIIENALLQKAIENEDIDSLQTTLLDLALEPTTIIQGMYCGPIHLAIDLAKFQVVNFLLSRNSDLVHAQDKNNCLPLDWAILHNNSTMVKILLNNGSLVPLRSLIVANHLKHYECHKILQSAYIKENCKGDRQFLLEQACIYQGTKVFKHFIKDSLITFPLIKRAATYGAVKIFQHLLKSYMPLQPEELEDLLHCSVEQDQYHIVKVLLQLDLTKVLLNPEQTWFKFVNTAHIYSDRSKNLFILQKYKEIPKMIPWITSVSQLMDLLSIKPEFQHALLANETIGRLIINQSNPLIVKKKKIFYYQESKLGHPSRSRRNSFFLEINSETNTVSKFKFQQELGEGSFGKARRFENKNHNQIVVKSLKNPIPDTIEDKRYYLGKEAKFAKKADPKGKYMAFELDIPQANNHSSYDYRFIMPFFEGENATKALAKTDCMHKRAKIIYAIALALQDLHDKKLTHEDIHPENLLILVESDNIKVRFIDFAFAGSLSHPKTMTKKNTKKWYPPECVAQYNPRSIKPHVSQDVYSLGYMLESLILQLDLDLSNFPSIYLFIKEALSINPKNRPTLQSFIENLKEELTIYPCKRVFRC